MFISCYRTNPSSLSFDVPTLFEPEGHVAPEHSEQTKLLLFFFFFFFFSFFFWGGQAIDHKQCLPPKPPPQKKKKKKKKLCLLRVYRVYRHLFYQHSCCFAWC